MSSIPLDHAFASVGTSAATAQLMVASIRRWEECRSRGRYPKADHLLIDADAGAAMGIAPDSGR
ncbi:hypothetical protein CCR95_18335 [Thiocystis minor]|uniref:ISAzo13-like element transposase-related protein n=1 Tax=Thiocystis minor TaxID=61597 RepID=UPI001912A3AC|nr:hypothetical protein [Thiocystis minor]